MDNLAFCSFDTQKRVFEITGWTKEQLFTRYDAVIHLVTTADGAEVFFNQNNESRWTDMETSLYFDK
jgi:hypothetical protein